MKNEKIYKMLIIEDDPERLDTIRSWLPAQVKPLVVSSPGTAMGILKRDKGLVYVGIMLDHDLIEQKTSIDRFFSGTHLIDLIIANTNTETPILIHSMNHEKAPVMAQQLGDAYFDVERIPFKYLSAEKFNDWLSEAMENFDENTES